MSQRFILVLVLVFVCLIPALGQNGPSDQKQSNPPAPKPSSAAEVKSDGKPLSKEMSDKLLQYAAIQAEKQKEVAESKPAKELALINDAIDVLVGEALRSLGLDSKKYGLKRNPNTGLLEAVPLAIPEPAK